MITKLPSRAGQPHTAPLESVHPLPCFVSNALSAVREAVQTPAQKAELPVLPRPVWANGKSLRRVRPDSQREHEDHACAFRIHSVSGVCVVHAKSVMYRKSRIINLDKALDVAKTGRIYWFDV